MEELLAYAYLLGVNLIFENMYEEKLHELFIKDPTDEEMLTYYDVECSNM